MSNDEMSYNQLVEANIRLLAENEELRIKLARAQAMVRIRAERKAGQVLSALNLLGNNQHGRVSNESISLKDCGITPDESYRWRTIAQLPDGEFENSMLERFQSGDDITTSFFYKAAKIHLMRMRGISTDRPQRPEPEAEIDQRETTWQILLRAIERDRRIALLERVIYECVSYRDICNSQTLTEKLYNEIVDKFEEEQEQS